MNKFNKCPECGSENTTDLDFDIRECLDCHRQYKPSIERLRYQQQHKTEEYYNFLRMYNNQDN